MASVMGVRRVSLVGISLILGIAFHFTLTILPGNVAATTLYVGGVGPSNYTDIQSAVFAANPNDVIFVYSGTYYENITIDRALTLIGENKQMTVIDGGEVGDTIHINADWVNITGFTIKGGGPDIFDAAIDVNKAQYCTIANNTVSSNILNGILVIYSDNNLIVNNNVSSNGRYGVYLFDADHNIISNNIVSENTERNIFLDGANDNLISNNTISKSEYGISLEGSARNTLAGNEALADIQFGLNLSGSNNNIVVDNVMFGSGIHIQGTHIRNWVSNTIDTSNTVNGKPVYYWKNATGGKVPSGAGEIILANCTNVVVENQVISESSVGVLLGLSSKNRITNNTVSDESYGIYLSRSSNNTVDRNGVHNSQIGVVLDHSSNNNSIFNNTVFLNDVQGIHLYDTDNNSVHHNIFAYNFEQAYDNTDTNLWDNGYPSGGNYWSDYTGIDECSGPGQDVCPDSDGLGDTPYAIDADSRDRYPLMEPGGNVITPPAASFDVAPSSGSLGTLFEFDASQVSDGEDPVNVLEVRWDWEDDGVWDTAWSTMKTEQHQYMDFGTYIIRLEVRDTDGLTNNTTRQVSVVNTPPSASFEIIPTSGNVTTVFEANASLSTDLEDSASVLEVRWDWEDDGVWDTAWTTTKISHHQYGNPGSYTIRLEVRDTLGLSNNTVHQVVVNPLENQPPLCAIIAPTSGATLSGICSIEGAAFDSDGIIQNVDIRIDGGSWTEIDGTTSWGFNWDTTTVPNGQHTIHARSFDGIDHSSGVSVTITVDNAPLHEPEMNWFWIALGVIIAAVVGIPLVFYIVAKRRKREKEEPAGEYSEDGSEN